MYSVSFVNSLVRQTKKDNPHTTTAYEKKATKHHWIYTSIMLGGFSYRTMLISSTLQRSHFTHRKVTFHIIKCDT